MNANIIPFEGAQLPARRAKRAVSGDIVTGSDYPQISIQGRVFSVIRDGVREPLCKKGTNEPVMALPLVILRANAQARQYYGAQFDPDKEGTQPMCFSLDGVKPDALAQQPQHATCAGCPHAVFGTAPGTGKGQACKQHARLAVAPVAHLDKPMLLRVPITSLQKDKVHGTGLRDLIAKAKGRGLEYNELLTEVSFDFTAKGVKLTFRPAGILDDAAYESACAMYDDPIVKDIVGVAAVSGVAGVVQPSLSETVTPAAAIAPAGALPQDVNDPLAGVDDLIAQAGVATAPATTASATDKPVTKGRGKRAAQPVDEDDAKLDQLVTAPAANAQQELDTLDDLLGDFDG